MTSAQEVTKGDGCQTDVENLVAALQAISLSGMTGRLMKTTLWIAFRCFAGGVVNPEESLEPAALTYGLDSRLQVKVD